MNYDNVMIAMCSVTEIKRKFSDIFSNDELT